MNIQNAISTLKKHQKWRRDNSDSPHDRVEMPSPGEVGMALDIAIGIMVVEAEGVDRDKVKARQAKLTEILDAPAQDNPEIKELMEYKAPWEGIK